MTIVLTHWSTNNQSQLSTHSGTYDFGVMTCKDGSRGRHLTWTESSMDNDKEEFLCCNIIGNIRPYFIRIKKYL